MPYRYFSTSPVLGNWQDFNTSIIYLFVQLSSTRRSCAPGVAVCVSGLSEPRALGLFIGVSQVLVLVLAAENSDWLVTKAQVHQCRVAHKHNINVGWHINTTSM